MAEEAKSPIQEEDTSSEQDTDIKPADQGETPENEGQDDELEKLKIKEQSLADAETKEKERLQKSIQERETRLRNMREKKRELKSDVDEEIEPESKLDLDSYDNPDEIKKFRKDILSEAERRTELKIQKASFESAKQMFYKTELGKKYDAINDSDNKNWDELLEHLHLTKNDLTSEQITRKLKGAALSHQQDDLDGIYEQRKKNEEAARLAEEDMGSGGVGSGEQTGQSIDPKALPKLTPEQISECNRKGINPLTYQKALKKVQAEKKFEIKL